MAVTKEERRRKRSGDERGAATKDVAEKILLVQRSATRETVAKPVLKHGTQICYAATRETVAKPVLKHSIIPKYI
jgi:hypothetical protein